MRWLALCVALWAVEAQAACRQALALGLDVSGSVDAREYRLQLDGLARALLAAEVQAAILAFPEAPVRVTVFEWSGRGSQRVLVDWTVVSGADDVRAVAAQLMATTRGPGNPATAIGEAMLFGASALAAQPECWRHVLDLSGDGTSNTGPAPGPMRQAPALARVTVNGLVVGADAPATGDRRQFEIAELSAYYRTQVIHGPDAFVEVALGFEDFERAMTRKLLRELAARPVALMAPSQPTK